MATADATGAPLTPELVDDDHLPAPRQLEDPTDTAHRLGLPPPLVAAALARFPHADQAADWATVMAWLAFIRVPRRQRRAADRATAIEPARVHDSGARETARHWATLLDWAADPDSTDPADRRAAFDWLGSTAGAYAHGVVPFVRWVHHGGTLATVNSDGVTDWQARLVEVDGYASRTVAQRMTAISGLFDWATATGRPLAGLINPAAADRVNRVVGRTEVETEALTVDQARALIAAAEADPIDRAVVGLLATTGIRVSELTGANRSDLRRTRNGYRLTVTGKGSKSRTVPVLDATARLVKATSAARGPLIANRDGSRLNRHQVAGRLRRLRRAARIDSRLTPHVLRATYVTTMLVEVGSPLWAVSATVGHADPNTTDGYRKRHQHAAQAAADVEALAALYAPAPPDPAPAPGR